MLNTVANSPTGSITLQRLTDAGVATLDDGQIRSSDTTLAALVT